jgi:hypothetical protein
MEIRSIPTLQFGQSKGSILVDSMIRSRQFFAGAKVNRAIPNRAMICGKSNLHISVRMRLAYIP